MKLPGADRAFVDPAKLSAYCLNLDHPVGKHKARVFASILGITSENVHVLHEALLKAPLSHEVQQGEIDAYGSRYILDFVLAGPAGQAIVRSIWIARNNEDFPRLVTCYVL